MWFVHRCNRWGAQAKADKAVKQMQTSMEQDYVTKAYHEMEEQQEKFEHYHERYNNHLQSLDVSTECYTCSDRLYAFWKIFLLIRMRINSLFPPSQIEMKLLQESQAKLREMERLGQALDKKGTHICMCGVYVYAIISSMDCYILMLHNYEVETK